jgi:hypothetical protein
MVAMNNLTGFSELFMVSDAAKDNEKTDIVRELFHRSNPEKCSFRMNFRTSELSLAT